MTLPYFRIYKRNTGDPLNAITKETDNAMLEVMIDDWIKSKRHEFEYTSVAVSCISLVNFSDTDETVKGAVIFASVPTCLQFADIKVVHWTAPAFWYASILLAVTSVVLAAQQTMVLSGLQKTQYLLVRDRLKKTRSAEPRWTMLHIWQIPIQCLSYSLLCFLIGLFSYVFSPLTQGSIWSGNAQVGGRFLFTTSSTDRILDRDSIRHSCGIRCIQFCLEFGFCILHRHLEKRRHFVYDDPKEIAVKEGGFVIIVRM